MLEVVDPAGHAAASRPIRCFGKQARSACREWPGCRWRRGSGVSGGAGTGVGAGTRGRGWRRASHLIHVPGRHVTFQSARVAHLQPLVDGADLWQSGCFRFKAVQQCPGCFHCNCYWRWSPGRNAGANRPLRPPGRARTGLFRAQGQALELAQGCRLYRTRPPR